MEQESNQYLLAWHLKPTSRTHLWLLIKPSGHIKQVSSNEELVATINRRNVSTVYTNSLLLKSTDLKQAEVSSFQLTPFEYQYLLSLLGSWLPDDFEESDVLDKAIHFSHKDCLKLIQWLNRYHAHLVRLKRDTEFPIDVPKAEGTFRLTQKWLAREECRIYPQGVVMDKHVYCCRWGATHWNQTLSNGFLTTPPQREPALLKACRKDPMRATQIEQPAFLLVNFTKLVAPKDYPNKQSIWVSNAELNALLILDTKARFTVEDILVADSPTNIQSEWINDQSLQLSLTHGLACKSLVSAFEGTWTMAWWRAMERANWLTLIEHAQKKHELVISGYGGGYLSFYCWSGEVAKLCELMKVRAAVLKQSDQDFDAEFKQEFTALVEQRYDDNPEFDIEEESVSEFDTTASISPM